MRVLSRLALVVVVLLSGFTAAADHFAADCPLSLAETTPAATDFARSPHGVFRSGSLVHVLRGQVLATYETNDVGDLTLVREDFLASLGGHETSGGVALADGHLYISTEAGLEIYDVRNTRAGGSAPGLVSRTRGLHYRRLAVSGNRMAALYPATDLPCYPAGSPSCANVIDIFDITNPAAPTRIGSISSQSSSLHRGFNDIAFNFGSLIAVSEQSLVAFDITNPASPVRFASVASPGRWLVSNGGDFIAVGNDHTIELFSVRPGLSPFFARFTMLTAPFYLTIDRSNPIRFSRDAWYDTANARLITMIEEVDPMTLTPARTIAFDVFDLSAPQYEGSAPRIYEEVTLIDDDEVKHNPVASGAYVYVIGERTGVQAWGACGIVAGRIELESPRHLTCNGAEIHGWVTGANHIVAVDLLLGDTPLGPATVGGPPRLDVSSKTPVIPWRIKVNLDDTPRGDYVLRAFAIDYLGNRRQFASKPLFLEGPGRNCVTPRRRSAR